MNKEQENYLLTVNSYKVVLAYVWSTVGGTNNKYILQMARDLVEPLEKQLGKAYDISWQERSFDKEIYINALEYLKQTNQAANIFSLVKAIIENNENGKITAEEQSLFDHLIDYTGAIQYKKTSKLLTYIGDIYLYSILAVGLYSLYSYAQTFGVYS